MGRCDGFLGQAPIEPKTTVTQDCEIRHRGDVPPATSLLGKPFEASHCQRRRATPALQRRPPSTRLRAPSATSGALIEPAITFLKKGPFHLELRRIGGRILMMMARFRVLKNRTSCHALDASQASEGCTHRKLAPPMRHRGMLICINRAVPRRVHLVRTLRQLSSDNVRGRCACIARNMFLWSMTIQECSGQ